MDKQERTERLRAANLVNWPELKALVQETRVPVAAAPEVVALVVSGHNAQSIVNNANNRLAQATKALRKMRARDVHRSIDELMGALENLTGEESARFSSDAIAAWESFAETYDLAIQDYSAQHVLDLSLSADRVSTLDWHIGLFADWLDEASRRSAPLGFSTVSIAVDRLPTVRDAARWLHSIDTLFSQPNIVDNSESGTEAFAQDSPILIHIESGSEPVKIEISANSDWITKVVGILERVLAFGWRNWTREGRLRSEIDNVQRLKNLGVDTTAAEASLLAAVVAKAERVAAEANMIGTVVTIDGRRIEPVVDELPRLGYGATGPNGAPIRSLPPPAVGESDSDD